MIKIRKYLSEHLTNEAIYFISLVSLVALIIGNPLDPDENFMVVWKTAGRHILGLLDLEPNTLYYMPENALNFDPEKAGGYVYAPNFAILLAILFAPISLPFLAGADILDASIVVTYEYLIIGLIVYFAFVVMLVFAASLFESREKQIAAVFLLSQSPTVMQLGKGDVEVLLVVASVVVAYKFAQMERWSAAGLFIGLSMVNWTTAPLILILLAYVFTRGSLEDKRKAVVGVIASQLPQILYFSTQPDELIILIQQQGNLATPLFRPTPIVEFILLIVPSPELYQSIMKPFFLIFFTLAGIYTVVRRCTPSGLLAGSLLATFPVSYLFSRPSDIVFVALILLFSIKLYDQHPVAIGTLISFFVFIRITSFFPTMSLSGSSLSFFVPPLMFVICLFVMAIESDSSIPSIVVDRT
jgi:hypothetical protein